MNLKRLIRKLLERVAPRHRLNDTWLYQFYLLLFYRPYFRTKAVETRFYCKLLTMAGNGLVFDIGANVGDKTAIFAKFADAVVSVEPTPQLVRLLQQRFSRYENVIVVPKAIGSFEGVAQLRLTGGDGGLNKICASHGVPLSSEESQVIQVPMMRLDQLITAFGLPTYVKIDVEGSEREVLVGLTHRIPLVSFEANLPEFKGETIECVSLLSDGLGMTEFNYAREEPPQQLESPHWLSAADMIWRIENAIERYLEIYCRAGMISSAEGELKRG